MTNLKPKSEQSDVVAEDDSKNLVAHDLKSVSKRTDRRTRSILLGYFFHGNNSAKNDRIQRNLLRESCEWKAWVNYFYSLGLRQECRSEEEDYIQQTCKNFSIGRKYRKLVEQVDLILWSQVQTLIQERE